MPFLTSVCRALSAATLLLAFANAQQCYYPSGSPSTDTPCSSGGESSCCGPDEFCMENGLCFGGGIVSRGSCTDQTWGSDACTSFCRTDSPGTAIAITPCTNDGSAVCGLNGTACQDNTKTFSISGGGSFVLRPAQVQALIAPALASASASASSTTSSQATATVCPSTAPSTGLYTAGQMAGLGCGLGLPLLFALLGILILIQSKRTKEPNKLLYNLPDNHDHAFRPPPSLHTALRSTVSSRDGSDAGSIWTSTSAVETPVHMQSFVDRYKMMSEKSGRVQEVRVELDGSEETQRPARRHELAIPSRVYR